MREHDSEPIPGLPEQLPEGERILWQGMPELSGLALRALHVRGVAIYFALLYAWIAGSAYTAGAPALEALASGSRIVPIALAILAVLGVFAYFIRRATLYTITNRRIVLRFGVALPMTMNIPFKLVQSAGLKTYANGSGDIPLVLNAPQRQSLIVLWPHVRPWRTVRPEPMLRSVPKAREVAAILGSALAAYAGQRPSAIPAREPAYAGNDVSHAAETAAA